MTDASYTCGDAPALTLELLRHFTDSPPEVVVSELQRFLWNGANFGMCVPLGQARRHIVAGTAGNFVYHQKTQRVFTGVFAHPLLLSYLATLNRTDFTKPPESVVDWGPCSFFDWNATSRLADEFVEQGMGLYLSATMKQTVFVDRCFQWSAQERAVFRGFARQPLHGSAPTPRRNPP